MSQSGSGSARRSAPLSSSGDVLDRVRGQVDEFGGRCLAAVDARLDLVGRVQEPAQHRAVADDPRVLAEVRHGGDGAGERVDRGAAADGVELAGLLEVLDQGQHVDRLAGAVQVDHRAVDAAVGRAVEVLRLEELLFDERGQCRVGEQHRAEHRLLSVEALRRGDRRGDRAVAVAAAHDHLPRGRGRSAVRAASNRSVTSRSSARAIASRVRRCGVRWPLTTRESVARAMWASAATSAAVRPAALASASARVSGSRSCDICDSVAAPGERAELPLRLPSFRYTPRVPGHA
jgi:hypothetical protein